MIATRHAVLMTSTRASASSAAQRKPSLFIATNSSFVTLCILIRLEWKVNRSERMASRARNMAGISVSMVVFELGTICPIRKLRGIFISQKITLSIQNDKQALNCAAAYCPGWLLRQSRLLEIESRCAQLVPRFDQ